MTALDDLVDALQSARDDVFRFEGRQTYSDDELWQQFLRGEWWEQDADLTGWCALVSATVDRGASWTRVRLVTEPWTDYTRWELEQHFPHNLTAGEDIRLLEARHEWRVSDFWMVDGRAWLLDYDVHGVMTPVEVTGLAEFDALRGWRRDALAASTPMAAPASS